MRGPSSFKRCPTLRKSLRAKRLKGQKVEQKYKVVRTATGDLIEISWNKLDPDSDKHTEPGTVHSVSE